jgi:polysaccharide pyruvyl transferase WcaK-like protein
VKEAVKIENIRLTNTYNKALLASREEADKKTIVLELSALALEKTKDETISRISNDLDAALKRLRNRPVRPSAPDTSKDSAVAEACTARELYREDAEFLTREAARANTVVAERNYYYQQYEKVRKVLYGIDSTN